MHCFEEEEREGGRERKGELLRFKLTLLQQKNFTIKNFSLNSKAEGHCCITWLERRRAGQHQKFLRSLGPRGAYLPHAVHPLQKHGTVFLGLARPGVAQLERVAKPHPFLLNQHLNTITTPLIASQCCPPKPQTAIQLPPIPPPPPTVKHRGAFPGQSCRHTAEGTCPPPKQHSTHLEAVHSPVVRVH